MEDLTRVRWGAGSRRALEERLFQCRSDRVGERRGVTALRHPVPDRGPFSRPRDSGEQLWAQLILSRAGPNPNRFGEGSLRAICGLEVLAVEGGLADDE